MLPRTPSHKDSNLYKDAGLTDTIKLEPVPGDLIVDIVRLARDAGDVLILPVCFFAHSATEVVKALCGDMELICYSAVSKFHLWKSCSVKRNVPKLFSISFSISSSSESGSIWYFERWASEALLPPMPAPAVCSPRWAAFARAFDSQAALLVASRVSRSRACWSIARCISFSRFELPVKGLGTMENMLALIPGTSQYWFRGIDLDRHLRASSLVCPEALSLWIAARSRLRSVLRKC